MKTKTYAWTSNKFDTIHTLRIYEGSKVVAKMVKIDGQTLNTVVEELKANGYSYKFK